MTTRTNDVLVGIFVLVLTAALIVGVLWFSAGRIGQAYDEYIVYMDESVIGLSKDSTVKYYGVDVGRVHKIQLGPGYPRRVRLLLQLEPGTPVKKDTIATLESQGLTGLAFINLTGGGKDAEHLAKMPGEELPVILSGKSTWGNLEHNVSQLVSNLNDASSRLQELLSDDNQASIKRTLVSLGKLSEKLHGPIDDLADFIKNARKAGSRLPQLMHALNDAAESLDTMAREISGTATMVRDAVSASRQDVKRVVGEAEPELTGMINELRRAAENFRRFSEQLDRDPSILLRGPAHRKPGPGE